MSEIFTQYPLGSLTCISILRKSYVSYQLHVINVCTHVFTNYLVSG